MNKIIKITLFLILLLSWLFVQDVFSACPTWENVLSIWWAIDDCLKWSKLVPPKGWLSVVDGWFKSRIADVTKTIWWILALFAVWAIVWWSFRMVISGWVEWDIKKWRDAVKWWILWFLVVVSSSAVILVVVEIVYWVAW
jgi:hypothetical protein